MLIVVSSAGRQPLQWLHTVLPTGGNNVSVCNFDRFLHFCLNLVYFFVVEFLTIFWYKERRLEPTV